MNNAHPIGQTRMTEAFVLPFLLENLDLFQCKVKVQSNSWGVVTEVTMFKFKFKFIYTGKKVKYIIIQYIRARLSKNAYFQRVPVLHQKKKKRNA